LDRSEEFHKNKVSIIISVYNSQKFLEECIESALNQTYQNIEIIAVDDGSTDNSLEILKKYSDKIKIISKKNGGTASALNQGIKIAKGEWIKRLDHDDVLYPDAVENLVSVGKNIEDKKKTMLYGHFDVISSTGEIRSKKIEPNYNNLEIFDFNVILLDHMLAIHIASLIHRSTFEEYGMYDESIESAEDYELWLRYCLLHRCRLHLVPKPIVKRRIHSAQITIRSPKKLSEITKQIINSTLEKLNPKDRCLYEKSLLRYKKSKPLILKIWLYVKNNIVVYLPSPISIRIMIFVRSNSERFRKVAGLDQKLLNLK